MRGLRSLPVLGEVHTVVGDGGADGGKLGKEVIVDLLVVLEVAVVGPLHDTLRQTLIPV